MRHEERRPTSTRLVRIACLSTTSLLIALGVALRAEDAALLTVPRELLAGGSSTVTLTTLDAASRASLPRPVTITLESPDGSTHPIFTGSTGESGRAVVPFEVPSGPEGAFIVRADVEGLGEPIEAEVRLSRAPAILIETDKPIYKPSQTIQGRVLLLTNDLRPMSGEVEITIHDGEGIRVARQSITAGELGAAPFELDLASEVHQGVWRIRARGGDVESVRDVRVEEYTLPRFELEFERERDWALVSEGVAAAVTARYFFGRDVEGRAVVRARRWVGVWEEYATVAGDLAGGRFDFELPAVEFVAGSPMESGVGSVVIDVELTDSTGYAQELSETLRVVEAPIVLGLVPRVRSVKPELPFAVLVTADAPDGAPLDAEVRIVVTFYGLFGEELRIDRSTAETTGGFGEVSFTPPAETTYARIEAFSTREGSTARAETRIDGTYSGAGGSYLAVSRSGPTTPAAIGESLAFEARTTFPGTVWYEVYAGGRTVLSGATETGDLSFVVTPPMAPKLRVIAYAIAPEGEVAADRVDVPVDLASSIAIETTFSPGREVRPGDPLTVTLRSEAAEPSLLGVSIVDESVLALGRSRLHLAEVFAELERRFLEPQVEAHEASGGLPVEDGPAIRGFFGPPERQGARDLLEEAGLAVATTSNIVVPEGGILDWALRDEVDAGGVPEGGTDAGAAPDVVRVRQYFPETWVWEPLLLTDAEGRAAAWDSGRATSRSSSRSSSSHPSRPR